MREEKIILSKPLSVAGSPVAELTMREPTMAVEEDATQDAILFGRGNNPITGEMCTFARLCGIKYEDIRALPTPDYEKLRAAYQRLCAPLSFAASPPEPDGTPRKSFAASEGEC